MTQGEYKTSLLDYNDNGIFLNGVSIVEYSEKDLMRKSVEEVCKRVKPKVVLEVGYGFGFSCDAFDEYGLERHYIVEPHPKVLASAKREGRIIIEDFIQNVRLDDEIDLIYDDMQDFTGIGVDWLRFNYHWYANMPTPKADCKGFSFDLDGVTWWQSLRENEVYTSFHGDNS